MQSIMDEKAAKREIARLRKEIRRHSKLYYEMDAPEISDFDYDMLFRRLQKLEAEFPQLDSPTSPTHKVGGRASERLKKVTHAVKMDSLADVFSLAELQDFLEKTRQQLAPLEDEEIRFTVEPKIDGLSVSLTYENGILVLGATRGDGTVGEVITNNAKVFDNIPLVIPEKGEVVIRGEAVISYKDFEDINRTIGDVDAKYKNPRNLCSGTVRQLNNEITAKRHVKFYGFHLAGGGSFTTRREQMEFMKAQGFETVEYVLTDAGKIEEDVARFEKNIGNLPVPSDGLVLIYDDIAYGESLGSTAKFPRDSIAFKWKDEMKTTRLREILWNVSRTGLINPIAIFEPVQLEGTTVSRASVHNLSIVRELKLGIGDEIKVYMAIWLNLLSKTIWLQTAFEQNMLIIPKTLIHRNSR